MKTEVSIIIPTFNEEKYIGNLLDNLLNQNFSKKYEILIIDGNSSDKTVKIVKNKIKVNKNKKILIKILENKKRKTPYAFNIGIKHASGKYISILGAHTKVSKKWISQHHNSIEKEKEIVMGVGGRLKLDISKSNSFTKSTHYTTSTILGGGISTHRYSKKKQEAKTIVFGMYRREVFKKIGLFDKKFIIGQDAELNLRIIKKGYKLLFDPKLKTIYYQRTRPGKFAKQMYNYGLARMQIMQKHGFSLKGLIPLGFIIYIISLVAISFWWYFIPLYVFIGLVIWFSLMKKNFFGNVQAYLYTWSCYGWGMLVKLINKEAKFK